MVLNLLAAAGCLAAVLAPVAGRVAATQGRVNLENPSSLELALTGVLTLAIYAWWAGRKSRAAEARALRDATRTAGTITPGETSSRRAA